MSLKTKVALSGLALLLTTCAYAQTAAPMRLRGTIDAIDTQTATMTTREGTVVKLAITKDTQYAYVKAMQMSDIKSGSFIGAAGKPGKDGSIEALEVVVFPEERRGTGEGHYAWDLLPESSMTNATVAAITQGTSGQDLNLVYKDGSKKVTVPKGTPIVTIVGGQASDVKAGLPAFVVALPGEAGTYAASRIIVGKDGVAPPM
ncbi:MAG: hypothetical protein H7327_06975 [Herminiimonas sp.]|nr:hypothetical protein [Herminiimonas sp.]